jgi:hypothetical protein
MWLASNFSQLALSVYISMILVLTVGESQKESDHVFMSGHLRSITAYW